MNKTLKSLAFGLLIIAAIAVSEGCKKKPKPSDKPTLTAEQDSILKVFESSLTLGPDSATISGLIAECEEERKLFQVSVNKLYPGLMKKYEAEVATIMELKNDNAEELQKLISAGLANLDKNYKDQFKKAWDASGINMDNLASKYKKWLGNWNFNTGDFGVITQALGGDPVPEFPADTTFNLPCPTFEVREENTSCGAITIGQNVIISECDLMVSSGANLIIGGCDNWGMLGKKTAVPAPVARVNATCKGDFRLYALAIAILGGSASTAFVGAEIAKGNAVLNNREHARIWAVAPIIWYSEQSQSRTAQDLTVGFARSTGSEDEINIKAFGRAGQGGLIGSAASNSSFSFRNGIQIRYNR